MQRLPAPIIDYAKLTQLCNQEGLRQKLDRATTEEAHAYFMEHYHEMFVDRAPQASGVLALPSKEEDLSGEDQEDDRDHTPAEECDSQEPLLSGAEPLNHDVRFHMAKLHKERKIMDPDILFDNKIKELKALAKKMPYERTAEDTKQLVTHLKTFEDLSNQVSSKELRELCSAVQQDIWKDEGYTVFANTGFFIILRGSVTPVTHTWMKVRGQPADLSALGANVSAEAKGALSDIELTVGDCFGTLERVDGPEPNSRVLCVQIKSVPCEFLKIHSNDFKRITDHIKENETAEKIALIQSCRAYKLWPRHSLHKLAELLEWTRFPQNTVLVSEGFQCPFIIFIRTGECHLLKEIEVNASLPNGDKIWKQKQVVVGQMSSSESFGEVSMLKAQPITSSVVTATQVEIGIITLEKLEELDETTRALLLQSNEEFYEAMTKDQIHDEYIDQVQKKQWRRYKQDVMVKTMQSLGITPGQGRWSSK